MLRLLAVLLMLCASALLGAELLQAREVLRPIADCPTEEAGTTCEVGGLAWYGDASKAPVQRKAKGDRVLKRFLVTGQLNGQPEKPYVLAFSQLRTDYFAQTYRSGPIAYEIASLGSPHLEVRTNRGSLRILSKFGIEPPPHIVVIDERSWLVVARYSSPCIDLSFLRRTGPFWDEGRGVCVSRSTRQELPRSVSGCQKPKRVDACMPYMMPSGFVPAKGTRLELIDENVRDFRTLRLNVNDPDGTYFGGSGWGIRAYRATGTPYLVLHGRCGDCDE